MKCAVIIAEYNPFHKGHQWQITRLREMGFTHIAAVMSGCFVQRGAPAVFHKAGRSRMALLGGVDLVIELPLPYACASAQRFAFGAVALADALGCSDALCFGSECGSLSLLEQTVDILQSPELRERLTPYLAQGMTFAKARTLAVEDLSSPELAALLQEPNNTLAMEYLLQLRRLHSTLTPITLPRKGVSHHEEGAVEGFASASHIRSLLFENRLQEAAELLPECCAAFEKKLEPIFRNDRILLSRLRTLSREQLSHLPDCSEGLENRLYEAIRTSCSMEEIWQNTKSKRYSLARIRRLTMSAFLGLEDGFHQQFPPYIRILGFNSAGRQLLAAMRSCAKLPVSGSLADLSGTSALAADFAALESRSVDLYNLFESKLKPCGEDFRFSPIRI